MVTQIRSVICVYTGPCIHTQLSRTHKHIYIYIEREGDVEIYTYAHIPICIYKHIIYTYCICHTDFSGAGQDVGYRGVSMGTSHAAPGVVDEVAIEVCNSPPPHPRGLGQPRPRGPFEDCPRARILVISVQEITNISARNLTEILGMDCRLGFYSTFQVDNPYLRFPSSL